MIKLRPLILENKRSIPIELDTVQKFISNKFRHAFLQGIQEKFLWRGMSSGVPYMYIEPQKHNRVARKTRDDSGPSGTNNFLNSLIDLLPSWKNWPKRSKSVIFTKDRFTADLYGKLYIVMPQDDAKIVICSDNDLVHSFAVMSTRHKSVNNVFQFNKIWVDLLYPSDGDTNITPEQLSKTLSEYDKYGKNYILQLINKFRGGISDSAMSWYFSKQANEIIEDIDKNYTDNFVEYFDKILNPEDNKFELKNIKEVYGSDEKKEMFTDSPCILIYEKYWSELTKS